MKLRHIGGSCALLAMASLLQAQAAKPDVCISKADLEDVLVLVAPSVLRGLGNTCRASIPANSVLRDSSSPFYVALDAESAAILPKAWVAVTHMVESDETLTMEELTQETFTEKIELLGIMVARDVENSAGCGLFADFESKIVTMTAHQMSQKVVPYALEKSGKHKGEFCPEL